MMTFLIADDSHEKIVFLQQMLKRAGWNGEILTAITTEEAKKIIDTHEIAAAFIDYYIPSKNGPDVIAYLRQHSKASRIALVSSADNPENTARALAAGAEVAICTTHESDFVEKKIQDLLHVWMAKT